jgi:hypothetical protein
MIGLCSMLMWQLRAKLRKIVLEYEKEPKFRQ